MLETQNKHLFIENMKITANRVVNFQYDTAWKFDKVNTTHCVEKLHRYV